MAGSEKNPRKTIETLGQEALGHIDEYIIKKRGAERAKNVGIGLGGTGVVKHFFDVLPSSGILLIAGGALVGGAELYRRRRKKRKRV